MPVRSAIRQNPNRKEQARKFRRSFFCKPSSNPRSRYNAGGKRHNELIKLNFGGTSFMLPAGTILQRWGWFTGNTLLHEFVCSSEAQRRQICDVFVESTNEYFFERSYTSFMPVYNYFVTGKLHKPTQMCPYDFLYELEYWRLPRRAVAPCCDRWITMEDDYVPETVVPILPSQFRRSETEPSEIEKLRKTMYKLLQDPSSSSFANALAIVSVSIVLISNLAMIVSTVEAMRKSEHVFAMIENVCMIWFIFEYFGNLFAAPIRIKFILEKMNLIDLAAILPFFIELGMDFVGLSPEQIQQFKSLVVLMRILRVIRVVRIFKLGRYSEGLQLFGRAMLVGMPKLSICGLLMAVLIMFFSTCMYYLEKDHDKTPFDSIPVALWWGLVTVSCVGYGDVLPVSDGRMLAALVCITGVIAVAIPVTVIVEVFTREQRRRNVEKKRRHIGITRRQIRVEFVRGKDSRASVDNVPYAGAIMRATILPSVILTGGKFVHSRALSTEQTTDPERSQSAPV